MMAAPMPQTPSSATVPSTYNAPVPSTYAPPTTQDSYTPDPVYQYQPPQEQPQSRPAKPHKGFSWRDILD